MPICALTPLDESSMSDVVAKGGLTLETTSLHDKGQLFSTGKITFSEFDPDSSGQDGFSIDGIKLSANNVDSSGDITGASTIKTTVDFGDDGSLFIKTTGLQRVDLDVGAISLGRRNLIDGLSIENARFMGNSYTAMKVSNETEGTKFSLITQLGHGSRMTQHVKTGDVIFSSDVTLNSSDSNPNGGFYSEVFLLARGDDLRLEFGRIKGSLLMNNIIMTDKGGNNLFGTANFGSLGLSGINIRNGYLTLDTRKTEKIGIQGKFLLQAKLDELFIENTGGRINLSNISLDMDSEIGYHMEFVDNEKISGVQMTFAPVNPSADTDIDFKLGGIKLSGVGGVSPTESFGSLAIENINLKNTKLFVSLLAPTADKKGIRTDVALEGAINFDFSFKDGELDADNAPQLGGKVTLSDFKLSQSMDLNKKGIYLGINEMSMSMKVSSVSLGNRSSYQGHIGNLAINSFKVLPGSYAQIQPLQ